VIRRQAVPAITVVTHVVIYDGYGSMSEYLLLGMERAGARVDVIPLRFDPEGFTSELRALINRSAPLSDAPVLYISWMNQEFQRFASARDLFVSTMWESSRLPGGWPEMLNQARAVIVPTRFVARICRDSGVTVPIEVVPDGIDPDVYHYQDRPERPGLTTLIVATLAARKHVREGVAAWKLAFAGDPEARLIIKSRLKQNSYRSDDPRIRFVDESETTRGIAHWYREGDVLLALGNEGFGLPLVEGMGTGLPVIALSSEGQADVCEEAGELLLPTAPVDWESCNEPRHGPAGVRGVPGVEQVAARLRWVAEHRDEARELGRAASCWALANRNVWNQGPAVLQVIEQHLTPRYRTQAARQRSDG
jgi:glycosyltransferase involved in cell wall biosynthesis